MGDDYFQAALGSRQRNNQAQKNMLRERDIEWKKTFYKKIRHIHKQFERMIEGTKDK